VATKKKAQAKKARKTAGRLPSSAPMDLTRVSLRDVVEAQIEPGWEYAEAAIAIASVLGGAIALANADNAAERGDRLQRAAVILTGRTGKSAERVWAHEEISRGARAGGVCRDAEHIRRRLIVANRAFENLTLDHVREGWRLLNPDPMAPVEIVIEDGETLSDEEADARVRQVVGERTALMERGARLGDGTYARGPTFVLAQLAVWAGAWGATDTKAEARAITRALSRATTSGPGGRRRT
jgi:hypothetical protein